MYSVRVNCHSIVLDVPYLVQKQDEYLQNNSEQLKANKKKPNALITVVKTA